jgi:hypothetical protein
MIISEVYHGSENVHQMLLCIIELGFCFTNTLFESSFIVGHCGLGFLFPFLLRYKPLPAYPIFRDTVSNFNV